MSKILFVMTGARFWTLKDGTRHPTGFWAEEVVAPYRVFTRAGYEVEFASPGGVDPEVDQTSLKPERNGGEEGARAMAAELDSIKGLQAPLKLEEVALADYAAVFYPGGHGPMEDLSGNPHAGRLLTETLSSGKPLGIVCHGPASILAATRSDGTSPLAGYRLTGFTNVEETQAGWADKAPWLLQDRLVELGADFQEGDPWQPHVVVDRNLYTGQNPASSEPLAKELIKVLS
jgi:putative intracellular protease/amidase